MRTELKSVEKTKKLNFYNFEVCISGSVNPRKIILGRFKILVVGH